MSRKLMITTLLLLVCSSAYAGVSYEFDLKNDKGRGEMSGSAAIEGQKMRLDLRKGDDVLFKDGSIMISTDGGKSYTVLDPKKKEYYEVNLEQLLSTAGSMLNSMGGMLKISFENHKLNVTGGEDGGTIEGYPTKKYVSDSSYDLVMEIFGKKNVQKVSTHTEAWVTTELDEQYTTFVQQKGFKTGMEDLDKMIEKETAAMKGFPLKSIIKSTTTNPKGKSDVSTMTMTVTSIKEAAVPDDRFAIPSGYERVDGPAEAMQQMMPH